MRQVQHSLKLKYPAVSAFTDNHRVFFLNI